MSSVNLNLLRVEKPANFRIRSSYSKIKPLPKGQGHNNPAFLVRIQFDGYGFLN
jgi:hypothetical protein